MSFKEGADMNKSVNWVIGVRWASVQRCSESNTFWTV